MIVLTVDGTAVAMTVEVGIGRAQEGKRQDESSRGGHVRARQSSSFDLVLAILVVRISSSWAPY